MTEGEKILAAKSWLNRHSGKVATKEILVELCEALHVHVEKIEQIKNLQSGSRVPDWFETLLARYNLPHT